MALRSFCMAMVMASCALVARPAAEAPLAPICMAPIVQAATIPVAFATATTANACSRPVAGSVVAQPVDLYSKNGVLSVTLNYVTGTDSAGRTLYCFKTGDGQESPTLHVKPGDTLKIALNNRLPAVAGGEVMAMSSNVCGAATMNASSINIHYHGSNTTPTCHSDEVIRTLVNAGQSFAYTVKFPADEPPGLYWYHPHVHGISEKALLGGASGAIVVDGIETSQPAVNGLPARILTIRDQKVAGSPNPGPKVPAKDLTLNYVPVSYPTLKPALVDVPTAKLEFWRVLNASADTPVHLQLRYDGIAQPLKIVALDGVATGSQDGTGQGTSYKVTSILIPPAGRAEFIVATPSAKVKTAILQALKINVGTLGQNNPARKLATLRKTSSAALPVIERDQPAAAVGPQRFAGIEKAAVTAKRVLYFSQAPKDPTDPDGPNNFFVTVAGAKPTLFDASNPPAIITTQGAVEQWTIENHAKGVHEFHIHQIHFQLIARDGKAVPAQDKQFLDTIQLPAWSGKGAYPSVTVLMDFRGNITGDFVYHCHILAHEDGGMMAVIRVQPAKA